MSMMDCLAQYIEDIECGVIPEPKLCSICGKHYLPLTCEEAHSIGEEADRYIREGIPLSKLARTLWDAA